MKIQTYVLKEGRERDTIGETFEVNTWDFNWYIGENRIGVTNNPSTEGESFMRGFLVRKDSITIVPSKKKPKIQRESESYGRMSGRSAGIKEVYDLIELIQGQEVTHAYQATDEEGYGRILTFSPMAPSKAYKKRIILPVDFDFEAAKEEEELERLIKGIDKKRNRVLKR